MLNKNIHISRRSMLLAATAGLAASGLPSWFIEENRAFAQDAPTRSPNERPHIALIGCGGQGTGDAMNSLKYGDVVAVCDVDRSHAEAASKRFNNAKIYNDFRKLLEDKSIDAVITGTPDHWHTLVNLAALKAGKDIYSEKPLTLTIDEGKRLVAAVRQNKRVLQTGSQQRSDPRFRLACELVRNGRIGKIKHVWVILPAGPNKGPFKPSPVPQALNWDFWQGQTQPHDFITERCHVLFRYWWDYSAGTITDWGAHHLDIALWGLGLDHTGPVEVEGKNLVPLVPGGFTAPSQYQIEYKYANGITQTCLSTPWNRGNGAEVDRSKPDNDPWPSAPPDEGPKTLPTGKHIHHGIRFDGEDGWLFITRGKIESSNDAEIIKKPLPADAIRLYATKDHMGNFIECIKSRKDPIASVDIGHRAVSMCHLGGIAIRTGKKLQWDPDKQEFVNDREANGYLVREQRKPYSYDMV